MDINAEISMDVVKVISRNQENEKRKGSLGISNLNANRCRITVLECSYKKNKFKCVPIAIFIYSVWFEDKS